MCMLNTRGLTNKLETVHQLAEEVMVLGMSETWVRHCDVTLKAVMDGSSEAPPVENLHRGRGGVRIIVSSLLPFKVIKKYSTGNIQAVIIQVREVTIPVLYISPKAKSKEEDDALTQIRRLSCCEAVIMGDLNARHTSWDSATNRRGKRIIRWAH